MAPKDIPNYKPKHSFFKIDVSHASTSKGMQTATSIKDNYTTTSKESRTHYSAAVPSDNSRYTHTILDETLHQLKDNSHTIPDSYYHHNGSDFFPHIKSQGHLQLEKLSSSLSPIQPLRQVHAFTRPAAVRPVNSKYAIQAHLRSCAHIENVQRQEDKEAKEHKPITVQRKLKGVALPKGPQTIDKTDFEKSAKAKVLTSQAKELLRAAHHGDVQPTKAAVKKPATEPLNWWEVPSAVRDPGQLHDLPGLGHGLRDSRNRTQIANLNMLLAQKRPSDRALYFATRPDLESDLSSNFYFSGRSSLESLSPVAKKLQSTLDPTSELILPVIGSNETKRPQPMLPQTGSLDTIHTSELDPLYLTAYFHTEEGGQGFDHHPPAENHMSKASDRQSLKREQNRNRNRNCHRETSTGDKASAALENRRVARAPPLPEEEAIAATNVTFGEAAEAPNASLHP